MKRKLTLLLSLLMISAFTLTGCGNSVPAGSASSEAEVQPDLTIIVNGDVEQITGDAEDATAVVLQDGEIIYVGNDEEAKSYETEDSQVIDAEGNTIMPTLTESHMHFSSALQAAYEIDLTDIIDVEEMQGIIKEFTEENPDLDVYAGAGWMVSSFENGSPTKDVIDEVCDSKPVMLQDADGHSYWLNSKALEVLNIDKEFAAEYNAHYKENGGRIIVDDNGEPTGHLKEAAANLISDIKPDYTVEQCKDAILAQQDWLASLGFTSVFDAGTLNMGEVTTENYYTAMTELAKAGDLKVRVHGSIWVQPYDFDSWDECKEYLDGWMDKCAELGDGEYYKVNTIKMMSDQVLEQGTAYMSEGMYAEGVLENEDIESNNIWHGKGDMMEQVMEYAGEHDLNLHIHQIGDASATFALDELEKAVVNHPELKENNRVCFAHCQFINEKDQQRMADLGVSAIVAPYWAVMDDYYWDVYMPLMSSQEALDTQYPMESLEKLGVNVAFHSDYVVTQPDMGWLFYSAETRTLPQKIYDIWYGDDEYYFRSTDTSLSQKPEDNEDSQLIGPLKAWDQALSLDEILEAATINGAKTLQLDDQIGSIETGKKADLMILNINLRNCETEELQDAVPVITFFDGKIIYRK